MTDTNSVILDENSQSLINVNKNHQSTTSTIKSSKLNQINSNNTNDVNNNKTIKTSTLQSDQNSLHKNSTSTVHKPIEAFADLKWTWSRNIIPPSHTTKEQYQQIVLNSTRVSRAIDSLSIPRSQAEVQAKADFESMFSEINVNNIKTAMYGMRKLWRTIYEGIRVNENGIAMLKQFAARKIPVILLPMHKSHIDYLLLSYVCFAHHIFPPHIVAGDNLNMPLVGPMLRNGGGLFIRRTFANDALYKSIFHEYIAALLGDGHNLACFIEGTRSRVGKVKTPKTGFLQVLVDLVAGGCVKDCMLVPIAISYDKVMEGATFVNEMLGAKKQKESLSGLFSAANSVVRLNWGSIDISICDPISLRSTLPSAFLTSSLAEQRRFVNSLSHRLLYEMNSRLVVSPTALVATVLLTSSSRGLSRKEISQKVDWLKLQVKERGGQVAHIFNVEKTDQIVDRTVRVISKLVAEQHNIIHDFRNRSSLELSFYRNQLIHFFISESLICAAMAAEFRDVNQIAKKGAAVSVNKAKLLENVRFISQLLKFEFIYKPAPDLEDNVELTIESLVRRGILQPSPTDPSAIAIDPSGTETFTFLCMLVWPFIEAYYIAIASLFALQPDILMEEGRLAELASSRAEALYYAGHIDWFESLNIETILTAYDWCVQQQILRVHQIQQANTLKAITARSSNKVLQLCPSYQSSEEPVSLTNPSAASSSLSSSFSSFPPRSLNGLVNSIGYFRKSRTGKGTVTDSFQEADSQTTLTPKLLNFLKSKL